jgi:rRNA-processing protein FCF1
MTVVVDTNALMMPVEVGVRLFDELERLGVDDPVVPQAVRDELTKLAAAGNGEEATAASVGLDLAERCRTVTTAADYADDAVIEAAASADVDAVVTNDKPLKDRLLAEGVPVIGLRGQHKLAITQP